MLYMPSISFGTHYVMSTRGFKWVLQGAKGACLEAEEQGEQDDGSQEEEHGKGDGHQHDTRHGAILLPGGPVRVHYLPYLHACTQKQLPPAITTLGCR